MRHRKVGRRFRRSSSHRKAMFMNLAKSLIEHEIIKTTVAKAKDLRRVIEPMITAARNDTVASRRRAFAKLRDKQLVHKLFADLAVRFKTRPGGYVRILKCGYRVNDRAPMAYIEFVEKESALPEQASSAPETQPTEVTASTATAE